jgi:predicted transposase YbfD/YdcC
LIDAQQFQLAFYEWVWAVNDILQGQIINIDGKCLRGSDDNRLGKRAIYMVSAWATENEIVLGQRKVDEKSNEITAIPELLKMLALSGCLVTIDAIGTQTSIAETIIAAQADYVLSVKENQGNLFEDISVLFAVDQVQNFKYASFEYEKTTNKGHGRIDVRECWSTSNPEYLNLIRNVQNWTGLQSIAMVVCTRIVGEKQTKHVRFYISSLPSHAKRILEAVRKHWLSRRSDWAASLRHIRGRPVNGDTLLDTVETGPMLRRPDLLLELRVRTGGRYDVEPRAFTARQRQMMAAGRAAASNHGGP